MGLPPWVRLVPDGRGGERIVWPEGEEGEVVEEDERHYWSEAHAYDDVGHPGACCYCRGTRVWRCAGPSWDGWEL